MIVYSHWALKERKKKIIIKSRIMKYREIYGAAKSQAARGEKGKRGIRANSYNNSSKCPDDQYERKREAVQKMISKKSWRRSKGSVDGKLYSLKTIKFLTVEATAKLVTKTQTLMWPVGGARSGLTVERSRRDQ